MPHSTVKLSATQAGYLVCPVCKEKLELSVKEENETEIATGSLYYSKCYVKYPIADAIPNLLPPDHP